MVRGRALFLFPWLYSVAPVMLLDAPLRE